MFKKMKEFLKTGKKRLLSAALSVCMLFMSLPAMSLPAGAKYIESEDDLYSEWYNMVVGYIVAPSISIPNTSNKSIITFGDAAPITYIVGSNVEVPAAPEGYNSWKCISCNKDKAIHYFELEAYNYVPIFNDGLGNTDCTFDTYIAGVTVSNGYKFYGWETAEGVALDTAAAAVPGTTYYAIWKDISTEKRVVTQPLDLTPETPTIPTGAGIIWNSVTKTLTLDEATIDCRAVTDTSYAIMLPAGSKIIVGGEDGTDQTHIFAGCGTSGAVVESIGILCAGDVSILGNGRIYSLAADTDIEDYASITKAIGISSAGEITVGSSTDVPDVFAQAYGGTSESYGIKADNTKVLNCAMFDSKAYESATTAKGIDSIIITNGSVFTGTDPDDDSLEEHFMTGPYDFDDVFVAVSCAPVYSDGLGGYVKYYDSFSADYGIKDYQFVGWFDESGAELENEEDAENCVIYTAKWKNSAGHIVVTTSIDLTDEAVVIPDNSGIEWDSENNKLTLNNATIDCSIVRDTTYALKIPADVTIVVNNDDNSISAGCAEVGDKWTSVGIEAAGSFSVLGYGKLQIGSNETNPDLGTFIDVCKGAHIDADGTVTIGSETYYTTVAFSAGLAIETSYGLHGNANVMNGYAGFYGMSDEGTQTAVTGTLTTTAVVLVGDSMDSPLTELDPPGPHSGLTTAIVVVRFEPLAPIFDDGFGHSQLSFDDYEIGDENWDNSEYRFAGWFAEGSEEPLADEYSAFPGAIYTARWVNEAENVVVLNPIDLTVESPVIPTNSGIEWNSEDKILTLNDVTIDCSGEKDASYALKIPTDTEIVISNDIMDENIIKSGVFEAKSIGIEAAGLFKIIGNGDLTVDTEYEYDVDIAKGVEIGGVGELTIGSETDSPYVELRSDLAIDECYGLDGNANVYGGTAIFRYLSEYGNETHRGFTGTLTPAEDGSIVLVGDSFDSKEPLTLAPTYSDITNAYVEVIILAAPVYYDGFENTDCEFNDYTVGNSYEVRTGVSYKFLGWFEEGSDEPINDEDSATKGSIYIAKWKNAAEKTVITAPLDLMDMENTDMLETEGWAWYKTAVDPYEAKTLILSNATIDCFGVTDNYRTLALPGDTTIIVSDDTVNDIYGGYGGILGDNGSYVIKVGGDVIILGNGTLNVTGKDIADNKLSYGISAYNISIGSSEDIPTLNIAAGDAEEQSYGIVAGDSFYVSTGKITISSGTATKSGAFYETPLITTGNVMCGDAAPGEINDTDFSDGGFIYDKWVSIVALPPLVFEDKASFDIPTGKVETAITAIDVSSAVSGGTAPYTFSLEEAPAWLTISTSGSLTGTRPETTSDATTATVKVTDSTTPTANTAEIEIAIGAVTGIAPTITTGSTLPEGVVGTPYTTTLTATGTAPITWSVTIGELPAGLTLDAETGVISGTPTTAGKVVLAFKAENAAGFDSRNIELKIKGVAPKITTATLAGGVKNVVYTATLAATGSAPITWSVTDGSLPAGLTLAASTGVISGTPTTAGTSTFTVKAENSAGNDTQELSIVITASAVAPTITTTTLAGGITGTAYTTTLAATGTAPITWSVASGSLPAGLTLAASTGVISGTPTTAGTSTFTVKAENSAGNDTQELSIIITATPVTNYIITSSAGANGTISPNGAVKVASGTDMTFTITPNSGYKISSVMVDGVSKGAIKAYTFNDVKADHTISAAFEKVSGGGGGGGGSVVDDDDDEEPYIIGDNGLIGWTSINSSITSAKTGDELTVNMVGTDKIPAETLALIKSKNVTVKFMIGGNIVAVFNKDAISDTSKAIYLSAQIGTTKIPQSVINKAKKTYGVETLSVSMAGEFSTTLEITLDSTKHNGQFANLFKYTATGELIFEGIAKVNGNIAKANVSERGEYLVVLGKSMLPCDMDNNGIVNVNDALAILKHIVELSIITDEQALENAERTNDTVISVMDALAALKAAVS